MMNPLLILQCDFENLKLIAKKKADDENNKRVKESKSNKLKELATFANNRIDEIYI